MLSQCRQKVLTKMSELEEKGQFDIDVEDDPPFTTLLPNQVDYLNKKLSSKILAKFSYKLGEMYYHGLEKKGEIYLKNVFGIENFRAVKGGSIITCNHFSFYDNYFIARTLKKDLKSGLYKVIREGNYTGFKGFYGFLFRHARTLPLSSNLKTMHNFYNAIDTLLKNGESILIYPEQAMWWNYRKPRPLKKGAFRFAVKSNVPVVPMFMTMEDTDKLDGDGYPVQAVTLWILPAIYKDEKLSDKENEELLMNKNYSAWVNLYEKVYNKKLTYKE